MGSIKVVVADDDGSVRHTMTALLHSDSRFEVVGHADTGPSLLEVTALTEPDVVLLDVRMPGGDFKIAETLATRTVVVAVSAETSVDTVVSMLRAGVRGYLAKGQIGASLPDFVARCAHGEVMLAVPSASQALRRVMSGRFR